MRTGTLATALGAALLAASNVVAQKANISEPCSYVVLAVFHRKLTSHSQANNHLDQESWSLVTDCVPNAYCEADGTCQPKRCRRDIVSLLCASTNIG